jgi:hypothetical protein
MYDRQTMLKNWIVAELADVPNDRICEYEEPVYFVEKYGIGSEATKTDKKNKAVKVVKCGVGTPVFNLDAGTLDQGMYVVRVIAAVPGQEILSSEKGWRALRKPLYMKMMVNDGLKGEWNAYRMSVGYLDEFYSTAEFYFHATEKRHYTLKIQVDRGSEAELLVHNITLDDVLAGYMRCAIKTKRTLNPTQVTDKKAWKQTSRTEERMKRDAEIWNAFPHINAQPYATPFGDMDHNFGGGWPGFGEKLAKEIVAEHGNWRSGDGDIFLVNDKLNLKYSVAEFRNGSPLPDPYPYKDDGAGLFSVDEKTEFSRDDLRCRVWSPIGWEVQKRFGAATPNEWAQYLSIKPFLETGDLDNARDVALRLIRFAYDYPSITFANGLTTAARRYTTYTTIVFRFRRHRTNPYLYRYSALRDTYDKLFDYIDGNEDLARFVPWVKTSKDVIKLIDTYLVQTDVKRIMRFQMYEDGKTPDEIVRLSELLGDETATSDWRKWHADYATPLYEAIRNRNLKKTAPASVGIGGPALRKAHFSKDEDVVELEIKTQDGGNVLDPGTH